MDFIMTIKLSSWVLSGALFLGFCGYHWLQEKGIIKSEISTHVTNSMLGIWGLALIITVVDGLIYPIKSVFYIVNGTKNYESIFIDTEIYKISPDSYLKVIVRGTSSNRLRSDTGIEETVESGVYIVNLSDHKKIDYERIYYWDKEIVDVISRTNYELGVGHEDVPHGKGVYLVTNDMDDHIYAFDEYAPSSRNKKSTGNVYQLKYVN